MLASINFHLLGNGPHAGGNVKDLLDGFLHAHEAPELVHEPGVCVLFPHVCNVVGDDVFFAHSSDLQGQMLPSDLELVNHR